jgi:hypothetical protein
VFGKKKHLLHDGTPARAVIVDAERHGGQITSQGATPVSYRLQLRVHLDDGTTFDAVSTVGGQMHSAKTFYSAGDIVPVRFDPEHRDTVLVDEPALLAAREDERRAAAEVAVERAERRLAGLPDLPSGVELPSDDALRTAHERWKTAASRAKEAKADHKRAQAGEDKRETLRAFNTSVKRAAEEKTARERYSELHKLRPDWAPDAG